MTALDTTLLEVKVKEMYRQVAENPLRSGSSQLRIIGIKMFLDGGMLTGSAYMRDPWGLSTIYSITDPHYRGLLFIPREYAGPCFIGFAIGESLGAAALRIGLLYRIPNPAYLTEFLLGALEGCSRLNAQLSERARVPSDRRGHRGDACSAFCSESRKRTAE